MPLDIDTIRQSCRGAEVTAGRQFCRSELDRFRKLATSGDPMTVACTQETPVFSEVAATTGGPAISFVNIRENAGWSKDAARATPKMAALLAAAAEPVSDIPFVSFSSEGIVLIYGVDEKAIDAADLLKDHLDVTVMISRPKDIAPRRTTEFPVVQGTIRSAKGFLGQFEIAVDDYATPAPSSRAALSFSNARDGATSHCDIILDLSGGTPLFAASDLRDGYLRADQRDPAAVLRAALKARDLVGTFDKPRYIEFKEDLCAHSRSRLVGCHRCLDLCPAGAITPAGDHVAIDPHICAGCGQCAAACPTGAAGYALPAADALMRRLRTMLTTYGEAGGSNPVLLIHDETHGIEMIDALARYGDGLPANVIPATVNETTQVGLETIAAAFAYGATAIRFLLRARPRHDVAGLRRTMELAETILVGLGFSGGAVATIETDDPDALGEALHSMARGIATAHPASFLPVGGKRDVQRLALRELHRAAPSPVDVIALPAGAPFGTVEVNVEGCTLCLACVSACPTGALSADPERPMLKFTEDACVQCGLCAATCPEKVITLQPQLDFRAATAASRVIKEEEPFHCIRCAKPFGVKSTIERVTAKLEGKHWMFKGQATRLEVLKMCEDCRVIAMTEDSFDPYGAPERPKPRTTDDYLREREENPQG
ncbi:4Fe-4S dicluster domain-containing protein [Pseudorhodoplanes sinuspersici]|uniref:4Fe-4S ferredoxin n=1 Tax=Pseudorhodoplanes sinuspersici TaxID=1235591 RepID=A0A1W7A0V5_9HYPH|nr:4Fe-4S dicluster domain-containing protein [Pseudorhodoplanes sinuspersici]ARQ03239.1 4Fe-4S ferredoxin [Pseudorhodoplanes sinuspersici]